MAFSAVGFLEVQTVAGAAQFTGALTLGGVSFEANYQASDVAVPRILSVGYDSAGDPHTVDIWLMQVIGTAAGGRRYRIGGSQLLSDGTKGLTNSATVQCGTGILVPRDDVASRPYWSLSCITVGKTGNGTLTVWFDLAGVPVAF